MASLTLGTAMPPVRGANLRWPPPGRSRPWARRAVVLVLCGLVVAARLSLGRSSLTSASASALEFDALASSAPLPVVRLTVAPEDLAYLARAITTGDPRRGDLPGGTRPSVDARYAHDGGAAVPARLRYRGHSSWHHHAEKPSLRVTLRKEDAIAGWRKIELQRPEDAFAMRSWLPNQIGEQLGMATVPQEHVQLFINDRNYGVYVRNPRPDPAALAGRRRMVGSIFKGDAWNGSLWEGAHAWRQRGETPESVELLSTLLEVLRSDPGSDAAGNLFDVLDRNSATKLGALCALTGSLHADATHNHLLHVSTVTGKAELMPWDMNGYGTHAQPDTPVDVVRHPFHAHLLQDREWVHERNQLLHRLLTGPFSATEQKRMVAELVRRLLPYLVADPSLASLERLFDEQGPRASAFGLVHHHADDLPGLQRAAEDWIDRRAVYLSGYLSNAAVYVAPDESRDGGARVIVQGNVAVRVESTLSPGRPLLLYPGLSRAASRFWSRPSHGKMPVAYLRPVPLEYRLEGPLGALRFSNAITGEAVHPRAERWDAPAELAEPTATAPAAAKDVVLGPGTVVLHESLLVRSSQTLTILAGTRLELADGVGIYSEGRTHVRGTEDEPVEILAKDRSFASFAVHGPASAGSTFHHMRISGGGPGRDKGLHFKGMFNIYSCPAATIDHCVFGTNAAGDDAVNLALSNVTVQSSRWEHARLDGLDIDAGVAEIIDSTFESSGNDGLDLMDSRVTIRGSAFVSNGDKGISVGERSWLALNDSRVLGNVIGIEVKDGSFVKAEAPEFSNNQLDVHGYRKKWTFSERARVLLIDAQFDPRPAVHMESFSELVILGAEGERGAKAATWPHRASAALLNGAPLRALDGERW